MFFSRPTLTVARELLGQRLVRTENGGARLAGLIVETEAYVGQEDLGCHARSGRTARNASMWGPAGHAYVYFTYGMHWLLNLVTEDAGAPAAILVRAILPTEGIATMRSRRPRSREAALADGPAKLCQALSIDRALDGHDVCSPGADLFVERVGAVATEGILCGPRVGLNSVPEPWKSIPWRFRVHPDRLQPGAIESHSVGPDATAREGR